MKKIYISILICGLFIVPIFALAMNTTSISNTSSYANYTEEELLALIAKLQKQLDELRKNVIQCDLGSVDLSIGDGEGGVSKENVKNLQSFLKEKGFFSIEPTGYFGKITKAALLNFQKQNGLTETGELDSATRNFVKTLSCKKAYKNLKTEIKETTKNTPSSSVSSISLTGSGQNVSWTSNGYSKSGFKIVWSKTSGPTYPTRSTDKYIYLSDSNANSTILNAFDGSGTYYVRVCEYLGGACGIYSNEIEVSL